MIFGVYRVKARDTFLCGPHDFLYQKTGFQTRLLSPNARELSENWIGLNENWIELHCI